MLKRIAMQRLIGNVVRTVKQNRIPFVGIKVWYGAAYQWSIYLARKLRKLCPETVVIAGGPHINVYKDIIARQNHFDLVVMGAGEEILAALLDIRKQFLEKKQFMQSVLERNHGSNYIESHHLDRFIKGPVTKKQYVIPKYHPEDLHGKFLAHPLSDGYGCSWGKCHFCTHTTIQRQYHPRPVDSIIAEIKAITAQGIGVFRLCGSDTPPAHAKKIAAALLNANLVINYSMFMRPLKGAEGYLDDFKVMIDSGLKALFIGAETGHDLINQRVMNKGVTRDVINATIQTIKQASLATGKKCYIGLAFIYPCPVVESVTLEEIFNENLSLIEESRPDSVIITPPSPLPETAWFEQSEQYGFRIGRNFLPQLIKYEYALYKPPEFWSKIDVALAEMDSKKTLLECGWLKKAVAKMGIPTDLTDEYFLVAEAMGCLTGQDLLDFKTKSLVDILAGSTRYTRLLQECFNRQSNRLAAQNWQQSLTQCQR